MFIMRYLICSVQAEAAEREVKSECLKYMAELSQQTAQLDKANDKSKLLSSELKDKVATAITFISIADSYLYCYTVIENTAEVD